MSTPIVRLAGLALGLGLLLPGFARGDEPLRVYTSGAPGAMIYVTPQDAIGADAASSSDIGIGAFRARYFRGKAPLQLVLRPGAYMVSVMPTADYSMNDAMMKSREYVWDGYDYHAIVDQGHNRWRYAQCYLVEKQAGFAAEVLAVFTDQMPDGELRAYDLGKKATRFTAGEEAAAAQLEEAGIPDAFTADAIKGLLAGMKMLIHADADRWVITTDGPERMRVTRGRGAGAWAGHRLSVCSGEQNVF